MINKFFTDPKNTRHWSSLRKIFHFMISRFCGVDGLISLTPNQMKKNMVSLSQKENRDKKDTGCNRQTIKKLLQNCIKEGIIREEKVGNTSRYYLLYTVDGTVDSYVKHFPFLESEQFANENVQVQNFVLYALHCGVYNADHGFERIIPKLFHSSTKREGKFNIFNKHELYQVLEAAKEYLVLEIKPSTKPGIDKVVVFDLQPKYANQDPLVNHGEQLNLESFLYEREISEFISDDNRKLMIDRKKTLFKELGTLGLNIFQKALDELSLTFSLYALSQRNEIMAYFNEKINRYKKLLAPAMEKVLDAADKAVRKLAEIKHDFEEQLKQTLSEHQEKDVRSVVQKIEQKMQGYLKTIKHFTLRSWSKSTPQDESHSFNKQKESQQKQVIPSSVDPIQKELSKYGLTVRSTVLKKWRRLNSDENILLAIQETLQRGNIQNVVGYVTTVLESGFVPSLQKTKKPSYQQSLPEYIYRSFEERTGDVEDEHKGLDKNQCLEVLELLKALGEIDEETYSIQLKEIQAQVV